MGETSAYQRWGKRGFDFGLALVAAIPAGLLMIPLIIAIRRGSEGPGLLRQPRVGRDGVVFTCYKLRTMFVETEHKASHETAPSAVTPSGRWLRRTKLDELPQLLNVLRGEMSFVGPRPCLPSQLELIEARRRNGVLAIRPGITGVAQVAGVDMSEPERLAALDATYLDQQHLGTDLGLILQTVAGGGRGDRVRTGN